MRFKLETSVYRYVVECTSRARHVLFSMVLEAKMNEDQSVPPYDLYDYLYTVIAIV